MPLRRKFRDDELVVSLTGFACHPHHAVRKGTRLPGSHPAVRARPDLFVPVDTPDDEIRKATAALGPIA
jgi:hypothetical protein